MKEKNIIRYIILIYWIFFTGLTVVDKIIPDVYPYWVGADFYTLFVKFFASLGLKEPIFATTALAGVAALEILAFVSYLFALINQYKANNKNSEQWFYRGVGLSILTFSFFSIGDQVFGDRNNLLEHGIFWIILIVSWAVYKYSTQMEEKIVKIPFTKDFKIALTIGILLTLITTYSLFNFSKDTFSYKTQPVQGEEVVSGIYKFDFPFLGDKFVMENTIKSFEEKHSGLKINYIYTAPNELNTKRKTHMLLYIFTDKK